MKKIISVLLTAALLVSTNSIEGKAVKGAYSKLADKAVIEGVTYIYREDIDNRDGIQITAILAPVNVTELELPDKINERVVSTLHLREEDGAVELKNVTSLTLPSGMNYKGINRNPTCTTPSKEINGWYLVPSLETYFPGLERMEVADNNPYMTAKNGVLFNSDVSRQLHYPRRKRDNEYQEPSSVRDSEGYGKNQYLKKVTFSSNSSYTYTPDCSYSNLETVCIPANIKNIWIEGFAHCSKLKQVQWHNGVKYILEGAFSHCTSLKKIQLPKSLIGIGEGAFRGCSNLNLGTLVLPKKLQWMQAYVFYGTKCKKVTIPDSVESMGAHAFSKQTKVVKPAYLKSAKSKYIPNDYFKNSYFSYEATALLKRKKKGKKKGYSAIDIERIWGTKKKLRLKKGKKITLQTKAELMLYANKSVSGYLDSEILKFRSSNPKVVKVTKAGKLQAKKKGSAVIQVSLRLKNSFFHVNGYKVKVKVRG